MKGLTISLLAGVAALGFASTTYAADLIIEEPAEAGVVDVAGHWDSPYIGIFGGYGWGNVDADYNDTVDPFEGSYAIEGWLVGAQLGFNHQMDSFVLGIEGDIAWSGITGDSGTLSLDTVITDIDWLGTIRGRAGFALDSVMIYATAGLTAAGMTHSIDDDVDPDPSPRSDTRFGWVAGVGAAVMVADNVSVQGDVLFHNFGEGTYDFGGSAGPLTETTTLTTVKLGVNVHF